MANAIRAGTIPTLRAAIEAGTVDPVDLVEAALDRIDAVEHRIRAFAEIFAAEARTTARQRRGHPGPLAGIPIVVKDICDVAGHRTGNGSAGTPDRVATADATVVRRLRAAGAVVLGKATTHEYAFGVATPPTRNPWSTDRVPGGSSGGTGAAVAARVVTGGVGTDTGGSIRIPAALCGVTGHKPTFGLLDRRGISELSFTLDHAGPLGRTVDDTVALLEAMAGVDGLRAEFDRGLAGLTIGVAERYFCDRLTADVAAGFEAAVGMLERAGARIRPVDFPDVELCPHIVDVVAGVEAAAWHAAQPDTDPRAFGADVRAALDKGARYTGVEYLAALGDRQAVIAGMREVFGAVDLLATPTPAMTAPPVGTDEVPLGGQPVSLLHGLNALTVPANVTGMPALTVPAGFGGDGLPIGLQLMGPPGADATVLGAGRAFEEIAAVVNVPPPL